MNNYDKIIFEINEINKKEKFRNDLLKSREDYISKLRNTYSNNEFLFNSMLEQFDRSSGYSFFNLNNGNFFKGEFVDGNKYDAPIDGYKKVYYDYVYRSIENTLQVEYKDVLDSIIMNCAQKASELEEFTIPSIIEKMSELDILPKMHFADFNKSFPMISNLINYEYTNISNYSNDITEEIDNILDEIKKSNMLDEQQYEYLNIIVRGKSVENLLNNPYLNVRKRNVNNYNNENVITVEDILGLAIMRIKLNDLTKNYSSELNAFSELTNFNIDEINSFVNDINNISFCSPGELNRRLYNSVFSMCLNQKEYEDSQKLLKESKDQYIKYKELENSKEYEFSYRTFLYEVTCAVANKLSQVEGTKLNGVNTIDWNRYSKLFSTFATDGNIEHVNVVGNPYLGTESGSKSREIYTPDVYFDLVRIYEELGAPCIVDEITPEIIYDAINEFTNYNFDQINKSHSI